MVQAVAVNQSCSGYDHHIDDVKSAIIASLDDDTPCIVGNIQQNPVNEFPEIIYDNCPITLTIVSEGSIHQILDCCDDFTSQRSIDPPQDLESLALFDCDSEQRPQIYDGGDDKAPKGLDLFIEKNPCQDDDSSVKTHGVDAENTNKDFLKKVGNGWSFKLPCQIHITTAIMILAMFPHVVQSKLYKQTGCFKTVTHYWSNPEFTGNKHPSFSYKNDEFHNVSIDLACKEPNEAIQILSIQLSLPALEDDFCPDSKETDHTKCSDDSQCECCQLPQERCFVAIEDIEGSQTKCGGSSNCTLEVTSQFLENCNGREYECEGQRCHSRWVEVHYTCNPKEIRTKEIMSTKASVTIQDAAHVMIPWWQVVVNMVLDVMSIASVVCLGVIIYCVWYRKRRCNNQDQDYIDSRDQKAMLPEVLDAGKEQRRQDVAAVVNEQSL